ncbi:MAG TPA: hypothetical protein VF456_28175 [Vicinamibacterales bacterium]
MSKRLASVVTGVVVSLAVATSLFAQGKSTDPHGNGNGGGNNVAAASGNGNSGKTSNAGGNGKGRPPSDVALAAPTNISTTASPSTPFAWIDNANLMAPGAIWVGISMVRWQNAGVSQMSVPVVDAAVGMTPRFQIGASVPRIAGSDALGRPAALGTAFFNAKVGILNDTAKPLKLAMTPTLEVLNTSAVNLAPTEQSRVQFGLPISAEVDRGAVRAYGSTGYFSPGVWFAGAGAGTQIGPRIGVAVSFSHAWSRSAVDDTLLAAPHRNDLSTGISMALTPNVGLFGSVGRTFKTDAQFGAGTTVSLGLSLTSNHFATE